MIGPIKDVMGKAQAVCPSAWPAVPPQNVRFYPHCKNCSDNQFNQQGSAARGSNQAANADMGRSTGNANAAVQANNAAPQTQQQMDAISSHVAANHGDNRYLGGQSYQDWK